MNIKKLKLGLQGQNIIMQKSKCPDTKKFTNRNGSSVLGQIMHPVEPCIIWSGVELNNKCVVEGTMKHRVEETHYMLSNINNQLTYEDA